MWVLDDKEGWALKNWCFQIVVLVKTLVSPLDSKEIKLVNPKGNQHRILIGMTCWSWSSNTLATWCEELIHRKRPWCWKRWRVKGEEGNRGWNCWMASLTQWTWVWANSWREWRAGKPGMLQSTELQTVGHERATEQQNNQISFGNSKNWKEESINTYQHRDNHQSQATEFLHKWFADRTAEIHYMLHQTTAESKCLHKITKTAIVDFIDLWLK